MTAHVAERSEGRGRVVLRLGCDGAMSDDAVKAAIAVAKAFGAGIECLVVEDRQLYDAAAFGFTREVTLAGGGVRPISIGDVSRDMALAARSLERRIVDLVRRAEVHIELRHVRDTPLGALAHACQVTGPWNVVALGEAANASTLVRLEALFDRVTNMTGVIVTGQRPTRPERRTGSGPVVAVVEHPDRLTGMIRTSSRIAAVGGEPVVVALVAPSRSAMSWLAREVHAALGSDNRLPVVELDQPGGGAAVVAESLRRLGPSFVVAEHGGIAVPASGAASPLPAALDCPILVVR